MKTMDYGKAKIDEIAAFICLELRKAKVFAVLTGGSCVAIYSKGVYVSNDLDFVPNDIQLMPKISDVLKELGFKRKGRHFDRKDCPYLIEFVNPPLSIGDEKVEEVYHIKTKFGELEPSFSDRLRKGPSRRVLSLG